MHLLRCRSASTLFPNILKCFALEGVRFASAKSITCQASKSSVNSRRGRSDSECFRVHSLTTKHTLLTLGLCWRYRCRCCRNILMWSHFQRGTNPRVHFHVKMPLRTTCVQRFMTAPLLSTCFSVNWSTCQQTKLRTQGASRPHQQLLIYLFMCLADLAKSDSPNTHKVEHLEHRQTVEKVFYRRRTENLVSFL